MNTNETKHEKRDEKFGCLQYCVALHEKRAKKIVFIFIRLHVTDEGGKKSLRVSLSLDLQLLSWLFAQSRKKIMKIKRL